MRSLSAPRSAEIRGPAHAVVQRWLVGLRWVAFALLAITLPVGEHLFGFHVRYAIALPVIALAAIVNVIAARVLRRAGANEAGPRTIAAFVAFDLVAIGIVLAASGGAANPFSALFLVHIALAAAVLPATTTFALSALAVAVFAGLFAVPAGSCCAAHARDGSFSAHLYGMWMAFVMCAGLVAFFVTRIRRALEAREAEVMRLRREAEHASRFASLGTLAAGTAHELGTPLGTIAVLAGEIAGGDLPAAEAQAHAKTIAQAVMRCRDVLSRMQAAAHASRAAATPLDLGQAVAEVVRDWRSAHPEVKVDVEVSAGAPGAGSLTAGSPVAAKAGAPRSASASTIAQPASGPGVLCAPIAADDFASALGVLLDNAAFAARKAGTDAPLQVSVSQNADRVLVAVEDTGTGVPDSFVERLGEPFLTTKEPGEGMGLGLYLARGLLEPVGGRLTIENRRPRGARAVLDFPLSPLAAESELALTQAAE